MKGFFVPPPISIGEARTLVLSLCAGSVWLGQRILGGGARARNPPSSAVVVYQVISGKGSEGFCQAEV
jgi:hypothetical protein